MLSSPIRKWSKNWNLDMYTSVCIHKPSIALFKRIVCIYIINLNLKNHQIYHVNHMPKLDPDPLAGWADWAPGRWYPWYAGDQLDPRKTRSWFQWFQNFGDNEIYPNWCMKYEHYLTKKSMSLCVFTLLVWVSLHTLEKNLWKWYKFIVNCILPPSFFPPHL